MSDKVKPRQHKLPKKRIVPLTVKNHKVVPLRAGHDERIVPLRIGDEEHEHGWNVGHTADEEWR